MKNKKNVVLISEETLKKDKTGVLKFMLAKTRHKIAHFIITTAEDVKSVSAALKKDFSLTRKKHYAGILFVNDTIYKECMEDIIKKYNPTLFINDSSLVSDVGVKCTTYSSFFKELHNRK